MELGKIAESILSLDRRKIRGAEGERGEGIKFRRISDKNFLMNDWTTQNPKDRQTER